MSCCFGGSRKKKSDPLPDGLEKRPSRQSKLHSKKQENIPDSTNKHSPKSHSKKEENREERVPSGLYEKSKEPQITPQPENFPNYKLQEQKVNSSLINSSEDEQLKNGRSKLSQKKKDTKSQIRIQEIKQETKKSSKKQQQKKVGNFDPPQDEPGNNKRKSSQKKVEIRSEIKEVNKKTSEKKLTHSYVVPEANKIDEQKESQESIKISSRPKEEEDFEEIKLNIPKPPKREVKSMIKPSEKDEVNTTNLKQSPQAMKLKFYEVGSIVETPMINFFRYDTILQHAMNIAKKHHSNEGSDIFSSVSK